MDDVQARRQHGIGPPKVYHHLPARTNQPSTRCRWLKVVSLKVPAQRCTNAACLQHRLRQGPNPPPTRADASARPHAMRGRCLHAGDGRKACCNSCRGRSEQAHLTALIWARVSCADWPPGVTVSLPSRCRVSGELADTVLADGYAWAQQQMCQWPLVCPVDACAYLELSGPNGRHEPLHICARALFDGPVTPHTAAIIILTPPVGIAVLS